MICCVCLFKIGSFPLGALILLYFSVSVECPQPQSMVWFRTNRVVPGVNLWDSGVPSPYFSWAVCLPFPNESARLLVITARFPSRNLPLRERLLNFISAVQRADHVALNVDSCSQTILMTQSQSTFKIFEFNFASKHGFVHFF